MGLSALNSALSGLRVSQQQINVISNNVANVGTPGYSRQILPQNAQAINGITSGVRAETVIRQVDLNLSRALYTQVSAVGALDVQQSYLQSVEQFHGPPDRELSIAADIGRLADSFAALSSSPEDALRQSTAVNQAVDAANKLNDLGDLIQSARNDTQNDLSESVARVNQLLEQIANSNASISQNTALGRTTAVIEDQRDNAIQELSEFIEVSSFQRGDGVLVVQTRTGLELASERPQQLTFRPAAIGPSSAYPDTIAGIFVGDPLLNPVSAIDLTEENVGGRIGGLIELRDVIIPRQTAQVDELAHKLAQRFDQQGLRLFTDGSGNIPGDTPPTPEVPPIPGPAAPAIPVEYIGFAQAIQVNPEILADNSLLQKGTAETDIPVLTGSNEVIRRVLEFTFGDTAVQEASGTIDLRVASAAAPTLQDLLGVFSENRVTNTRDLVAFGDFTTAAGSPFAVPGTDTFSITIDPAGELGAPVGPLNVNISALAPPSGATELAAAINALDPGINATITPSGELEITSRFDLEIADVNLGTAGLQFLGLNTGTFEATDPHFDIQVGNAAPVRITLEPGDTETDLINKLILDPTIPGDTGVPGLAFDAATFAATGELILRPGDDFNTPEFGGDISIVSGSFEVDAANAAINAAAPGTLPDGVNFVSALFGSFTASGQDVSPISNINYGSETETGSNIFVPFRENLLGPDLSVSTNVIGSQSLLDFAQNIVNQHTQELILTQNRIADEDSLRGALQQQLLDESGVNIDEELSNLIVVQTAYSAAARVITAVDELFQELLNAVR